MTSLPPRFQWRNNASTHPVTNGGNSRVRFPTSVQCVKPILGVPLCDVAGIKSFKFIWRHSFKSCLLPRIRVNLNPFLLYSAIQCKLLLGDRRQQMFKSICVHYTQSWKLHHILERKYDRKNKRFSYNHRSTLHLNIIHNTALWKFSLDIVV